MAVSGDGAFGSNSHFIGGRHVVLINNVAVFLQGGKKPNQCLFSLQYKGSLCCLVFSTNLQHVKQKSAILAAPPTSFIVVPHSVTGNWKMANAELESTAAQEGWVVSSRLIDSTSICGQVASRDTTTTNWPSLVHCTVTG